MAVNDVPSPTHRPDHVVPSSSGPLRIDCDDCVMQHSDACTDCVVTFICGREPGDALIIDAGEERAVRLLIKGGLVPGLRHEPAAG